MSHSGAIMHVEPLAHSLYSWSQVGRQLGPGCACDTKGLGRVRGWQAANKVARPKQAMARFIVSCAFSVLRRGGYFVFGG